MAGADRRPGSEGPSAGYPEVEGGSEASQEPPETTGSDGSSLGGGASWTSGLGVASAGACASELGACAGSLFVGVSAGWDSAGPDDCGAGSGTGAAGLGVWAGGASGLWA